MTLLLKICIYIIILFHVIKWSACLPLGTLKSQDTHSLAVIRVEPHLYTWDNCRPLTWEHRHQCYNSSLEKSLENVLQGMERDNQAHQSCRLLAEKAARISQLCHIRTGDCQKVDRTSNQWTWLLDQQWRCNKYKSRGSETDYSQWLSSQVWRQFAIATITQ